MARRPFIAGNWKMHLPVAAAVRLAAEVRTALGRPAVRVAVLPPFTSLHAVSAELRGSGIEVGGQNVHWEKQGAFTGEVSAEMLLEAGCTCVVVGHSERRQLFGETDEGVARRTRAALEANLTPIACVGETLAEREAGQTLAVVSRQVRALATGLPDIARVVIAYEPVWAIGTGRNATAEQAQEVHASIRALLRELHGAAADQVVIQYGGSVKPDNAGEILSQPDVDGALVGGASLKADSFAAIVKASQAAAARG